ncbi:splicing regulator RBM11 isoform X2 [Mauremys mutica]|uniref:splicing regulator RBM11 isoform X1 n=1 Tax=Mauremys mutica TaxID=74926 RepID=UPI001D140E36|nr:splicing regulator RBM11 isoform X1 [Mauremys mutica]XP_044858077.1 splicing regulator RBM11 isoform X2 [Mauremys mutica]
MSAPGRAGEPDRTLFVGNLESRVREEILYELFLQAGPLTNVTICKDKEGKPKSFGFVCFKHTESVPYAIALLNGIRLYGRPIKVQYRFGSSHSPELNSPSQGFENWIDMYSPTYRNQEPYGSPPFPITPFPMNNSLPQEYSVFQKMMSHFLTQQYAVYSPMEQQLPYYQMTPPPSSVFPMPPYMNPVEDFKAGQSSFEWVPPQLSDCESYLANENACKRKREQQTSDSDSSMENDRKKQREHGQKYRKCKIKKKRH